MSENNAITPTPAPASIKIKEVGFWLSYDLGIKGNYPALYAWLEENKALECGANLAYMVRRIPEAESGDKLRMEIAQEIKNIVDIAPTDRFYLIHPTHVGSASGEILTAGIFIIGGRKNTAPWTGYGQQKQAAPDTSLTAA